jgi:adenosylcobyric acid synthase
LEAEPSVDLRYVASPDGLDGADLVVLPGTKRTADDLDWLRVRGLARALERRREAVLVVGICGGMQMLGTRIDDPAGIEGGGTQTGFGWLPIETILEARKVTRVSRGSWTADTLFAQPFGARRVEGYEIHVGHTRYTGGAQPAIALEHGADGAQSADGRVVGTYLHGLFERDEFRYAFLSCARAAQGLSPSFDPNFRSREREARIDRWARHVERHVDLARLLSETHPTA